MPWCLCLQCPRKQRFEQDKISGAKCSRKAMKFVLGRTSTYQHGISMYEKKYSHERPCTAMYQHILTYTAMYFERYMLLRTGTYF